MYQQNNYNHSSTQTKKRSFSRTLRLLFLSPSITSSHRLQSQFEKTDVKLGISQIETERESARESYRLLWRWHGCGSATGFEWSWRVLHSRHGTQQRTNYEEIETFLSFWFHLLHLLKFQNVAFCLYFLDFPTYPCFNITVISLTSTLNYYFSNFLI